VVHLDSLDIQGVLATKEIKAPKEVMVHLVQKEKGDEMEFQAKEDKLVLGALEANVVELEARVFLDLKEILGNQGRPDQLE